MELPSDPERFRRGGGILHLSVSLLYDQYNSAHFQAEISLIKANFYGPHKDSIECQKDKEGFPGGAVVENLPANAWDTGSSPGLGRSHMPRSN